MSYESYGEDESGYSWDGDDDEGGTLTASGQTGKSKTPPVAPPKPIHNSQTEEGEYEDDDEYYDDEEEGEYYDDDEEGEYYDDEEYDDEEYDDEEYDDEEYDDEEYDDEEYDDEEYDDEEYDDEEYDDEEEVNNLLGPSVGVGGGLQQQQQIGTEYESRIEEDDDDNEGWYSGEDEMSPQTVSQNYNGILGKVGGAASNAVQNIRKSLGSSSRQGGGGYVKPPEKGVLGAYGANLKIVKNPTPLKERIPRSMRGNNNKLDYSKIKGNLKKGAPTSRPLTGLHKPVNPGKGQGGGKRPPSRNRSSHRRRPPSNRKKSKEPASWANKRKNLKKANPNRPLTGLYQPVGGPKPGGGAQTTDLVNGHVPSKGKPSNKGVVKASKPKYAKSNKENRIQSRRRKLKKAPRERPLTGYFQPADGGKAPKGQESNKIVEGYVPKKSRNDGRSKGGYVKGSKPKYKRKSKADKLVNARQGLKKGPTKRPLTGLHQPVGNGKGKSSAHTVNNFVPKQRPRNGVKKEI